MTSHHRLMRMLMRIYAKHHHHQQQVHSIPGNNNNNTSEITIIVIITIIIMISTIGKKKKRPIGVLYHTRRTDRRTDRQTTTSLVLPFSCCLTVSSLLPIDIHRSFWRRASHSQSLNRLLVYLLSISLLVSKSFSLLVYRYTSL